MKRLSGNDIGASVFPLGRNEFQDDVIEFTIPQRHFQAILQFIQ
jgi:hypothetical protein